MTSDLSPEIQWADMQYTDKLNSANQKISKLKIKIKIVYRLFNLHSNTNSKQITYVQFIQSWEIVVATKMHNNILYIKSNSQSDW